MTFEQILTDLKNKIYKPVYFLMGNEPYFIDEISDFISKNVLKAEEKDFNQTILYGKETDIRSIIMLARRFPMMANYQVIIVKEAQDIKNMEDLIFYIEKPLNSTILVINYKYKSLDKRTRLCKMIDEKCVLFESPKLYEDKIPGWIGNYVKSMNYSIDVKGAALLTEFLGSDLEKIVNELRKLFLVIPQQTKITSLHIEKYIGISKEYNNFELQNALAVKNALKCYRIVNHFASNQKDNPFVLTIVILYMFFSKLLLYHTLKDKSRPNAASELKVSPYFMKEYEQAYKIYSVNKVVNIIGTLREYDLKSKGVNNTSVPPGELLKELVTKILN